MAAMTDPGPDECKMAGPETDSVAGPEMIE